MTNSFAGLRIDKVVNRNRVLMLFALVSPLLGAGRTTPPAERTAEELQIAFVFNFAKFTEWPADPSGTNNPFLLCVLGAGSEDGLADALANRKVHGRRVDVVRLQLADDARRCQVLLLRGLEPLALARTLGSLRGASVLTVGESEDFLDQGGIIRFVVEGKALRFDVHLDSAATAHLKLNASLLALARKTLGARSSS